ncbi:MAG TPA: hypothetical protein DDW55_12515 [Gammaproteobacteria bacterium]|nr:hypothetical protein [Gammaproteobacteria bacterium]
MIWLGVLIAALVTVPVSVNVHDKTLLAQAEQERVEIAALVEFENEVYFYDQEADNFDSEVYFYDKEAK